MKINQKGFGAVEGLLIVIIVLLVGFIGYYVYHTSKTTNSLNERIANTKIPALSQKPSNTQYAGWQTYKGTDFILKFPANWKLQSATSDYPDDIFLPPNSTISTSPFVYIETGTPSVSDAASDWQQEGSGRAGTVSESKASTINGYSAYYVVTSNQGGTLNTYALLHKNKSVYINLENGNTNKSFVNILTQIADSVVFTN